jgi:3-dehydroquinate dehydratase / shikimate dehydrogenase
MICVALTGRSNEEMLRMMHESAPNADLLELRIDYIAEPDVRKLLEARSRPVIVTCRPAEEGGMFAGTESRRIALLEQAASLGAEYVDIELASAAEYHGKGAKKVVSHHDFRGVPADAKAIHARLVAAGADVAKIAVTAHGIHDNLVTFDLLKDVGGSIPTIALCMGEHGLISRILAPKFGGFLTFAAAQSNREVKASAPGQITARQLREEFRYGKVGPRTALYGVIGKPIAHSLSPAIHNAAYDELGIDAVYVPFLVDDVRRFVPAFRALGVRGFSVTLPHKEALLETADAVDSIAEHIGAANTLYEKDGQLRATNTDCLASVGALARALRARTPDSAGATLGGRHVVVCGAGGAARALVFGLVEQGANVTIVNRTPERGQRLAQDAAKVGPGTCQSAPTDSLMGMEFDVLCNLTSVGMHPNVDETPVPREALKPQHVVFDAVYNPLETRLLREAKEIGCTIVPGLDWFIGQAAAQFELWFGRPAPTDTMRAVAERQLRAR